MSSISTDRYRVLVEGTSDLVQRVAPDGRIVFANGAFRRALGLSGMPAGTPSIFDVLDPSCHEACRTLIARVFAGEDVGTVRLSFRDASGAAVPVEGHASLEHDGCSPASMLGIFRDVRELRTTVEALRRSEERLTLALQGSRLAIWDFHVPTGVVHLGEEWARLSETPAQPSHELHILDLQSLVHPDDVRPLQSALVQTLKGLQPYVSVDHRIRTAGGAWKWVTTHGMVAERDEAGRAVRLTGTTSDIDARKRAEDELRDARLAAEAATRAKGVFLATVSHEVRTPVNAISGSVDLLERTPLDEEQSHLVRVLREACDSLLQIVSDVLDVSKLESGQFAVRFEAASLRAIVESAAATFAGTAQRRGIALRTVVDPTIAPALRLDPLRLKQILFNLVGNALKFTDRGHVEIRAQRMFDTDRGQVVRMVIEDTGAGIAPDDQRRLFQPFVQATSNASSQAGSGLGLVIARRLAELMGGTLSMASTVGRGTTMTLLIRADLASPPRQALSPVAGATAEPVAAAAADQGATAAARVRLLVVDDDELNRVVMKRQLAALGVDADLASNGEEALRAWQQTPYPLVVLDCQMPVLDGYGLARRIRAIEADRGDGGRTPLVAYTANGDDDERCLAAGIDAVLAKPVSLAAIRQTLRRWLPGIPSPAEGTGRAVNLARLSQISGGDAALEQDLLTMFHRRRERDAHALSAAMDAHDWPAVAALAHRLKGAAQTIAAEAVAAICAQLEQAARRQDGAAVGDVRSRLSDALLRLSAFLDDRCGAAAPPATAGAEGTVQPQRSSLSRLGVLVVDDDDLQRRYVHRLLTRLGVVRVLEAESAAAALDLLDTAHGRVDVIVCDLELPDMDGMKLLRVLASRGLWPSVIVTSAADVGRGEAGSLGPQVVPSSQTDVDIMRGVEAMADAYGFHVLGSLRKPATADALHALLRRHGFPRDRDTPSPAERFDATAVRAGFERREFEAYFQPQVDMRTGRLRGAEALVRWRHPTYGVLPPGDFLDEAYQAGLLRPLTWMLIEDAAAWCARWRARGLSLTVSVNLFLAELDDVNLPDRVVELLRSHDLPVQSLTFEITEASTMSNVGLALEVLARFRMHGFGLSLDDFGTGSSTLQQLSRIPFSELKLDRTFVTGASDKEHVRPVIAATIAMARDLGISIVGEGVETLEDWQFLEHHGVHAAQGFYISRPMPASELEGWAARWPTTAPQQSLHFD